MRQWDTKKQFKPRYGFVAGVVFLGIFKAIRHPEWKYAFYDLLGASKRMAGHLLGVLLAVVILALSPVIFPAFLALECWLSKHRRLDYLRRNRAADEDI